MIARRSILPFLRSAGEKKPVQNEGSGLPGGQASVRFGMEPRARARQQETGGASRPKLARKTDMKRLLLAALVGLGAWLQIPSQVMASGAFGLFTCGGCCKKCGCEVCIRPYNAFSPVLCGSICVDNCFPFSGPQCACAPPMGHPMGMPVAPMVPFAPAPYGAAPYGAAPWPGPMPPVQGAAPMPGHNPATPVPGQPSAPPPPVGTPGNPEQLKPPTDGQTIASKGMVQPANYYPYPYPYQYPGYLPYYQPMAPMTPWIPYPMVPQYPAQY